MRAVAETMRMSDVSWVRGRLRAELTGRWEEGEPQKDTVDWRTYVKFRF